MTKKTMVLQKQIVAEVEEIPSLKDRTKKVMDRMEELQAAHAEYVQLAEKLKELGGEFDQDEKVHVKVTRDFSHGRETVTIEEWDGTVVGREVGEYYYRGYYIRPRGDENVRLISPQYIRSGWRN